jgi:cyclin B
MTKKNHCESKQYSYEISGYVGEIGRHLMSLNPSPPTVNYFADQQDITEHMRAVLLGWIVDVHLKYKLMPETYFLTVDLIDRYLSIVQISRHSLQLLGIASLWIAAKYHETYQVPKLINLEYICDHSYSAQDILKMEASIHNVLHFDLLVPNIFTYFQMVIPMAQLSHKDQLLGAYLLECMSLNFEMRRYSPLSLAMSLIFFIKKLRGYGEFC